MQVSVESTGPLERTMTVEIPEERIAGEVASRLQSLSRTTRLQGFRPGKVPMKVIQQRFGSRVRQEVVGEVVQSSFYEAITREKLRPAGSPEIDPLTAEQGEGLSYTARFEVMPEPQVPDVAALSVVRPRCHIDEADIDKMVQTLREQRRVPEPRARPAATGDIVEIDFVGTVDGAAFEGGSADGFTVELGSGRLIQGFEDGLLGHRAGDKVALDLEFPADYQKAEVAGKPVRFDITVNQVSEPVLPALDDEFFTNFGIEEGGEQAFRKEVREHMHREAETALRRRLRDAVMAALFEASSVELPNTLVQQEIQRLQQQLQRNLKNYGIEVPADDDSLSDPARFEEQARRRVTLQLVVAEIVRNEGLTADPAKVRALIEKNAQSYEDPRAIVNWYYEDKQRLADVEALVLEDEVIDWIVTNARVTEEPVAFDDLMNKGQTEAV